MSDNDFRENEDIIAEEASRLIADIIADDDSEPDMPEAEAEDEQYDEESAEPETEAEAESEEESEPESEDLEEDDRYKWYLVHTFTGYENRVKSTLEQSIEANQAFARMIREVSIPEEEVVERNKDGKEKVVRKKTYPGYIIVKMAMSKESWYIVRNTKGVTGFVSADPTEPQPLTDEEIELMFNGRQSVKVSFYVGETVNIIDGALAGFSGVISELDEDAGKAKLTVPMFGKENIVIFDLDQLGHIQ